MCPPTESIVLELPGTRIHGTSTGTGPPLVLLHGGPGCGDYFKGSVLVDWCSPAFRVMTYAQRGCEASKSNGPFTLQANIEDLDALRSWLGVDQLNLLGHSFGAVLAVHYTAVHPKRVNRLALMNPAGVRPGWRSDFDQTIRNRLTTDDAERLTSIGERIRRTRDDTQREQLYMDRFNAALPCYVDQRHRELAPELTFYSRVVNVSVGGSVTKRQADRSWEDTLRGFDGTAGIIHGRSDPIPWSVVEDLREIFPAARVWPLEKCGHFPWLEQPDACRSALVAFLQAGR